MTVAHLVAGVDRGGLDDGFHTGRGPAVVPADLDAGGEVGEPASHAGDPQVLGDRADRRVRRVDRPGTGRGQFRTALPGQHHRARVGPAARADQRGGGRRAVADRRDDDRVRAGRQLGRLLDHAVGVGVGADDLPAGHVGDGDHGVGHSPSVAGPNPCGESHAVSLLAQFRCSGAGSRSGRRPSRLPRPPRSATAVRCLCPPPAARARARRSEGGKSLCADGRAARVPVRAPPRPPAPAAPFSRRPGPSPAGARTGAAPARARLLRTETVRPGHPFRPEATRTGGPAPRRRGRQSDGPRTRWAGRPLPVHRLSGALPRGRRPAPPLGAPAGPVACGRARRRSRGRAPGAERHSPGWASSMSCPSVPGPLRTTAVATGG
ncbi:hypothetical protein EES47_09840 [Streptomyces sp. ADI98-12]|nr:hypothetical protein EES47_09840 [Streptomyces sp. ADI98-12]